MAYQPTGLIEVHAAGRLVGAVALDPATGFFAFEYSPDWIENGPELAPLTMPNRPGVFVFADLAPRTYHRLPALVADSLPDRFGNALVNARLADEGIEPDAITPLDRLAYLADRGMGVLEYRPPFDEDPAPSTALSLADLVVAARGAVRGDFDDADTTAAALTQLIQVGTSAGGARAKAVISLNPATGQIRSGQVPAPPGFEPWLLKLDGVDDARDSLGTSGGYGRIEYAYHLMARQAGIEMADCRLLPEHDRAHFMTRRFDRTPDGGRIHTQTLCALAHLDFNLPRAHSYAQYLDVVDRLGLGPDAREQAFRRIVFNVAAVNRDDHTKNLGFVRALDGDWALAPAYDLTHAHNPRGEWTDQHQMSVGGKFDAITSADLLSLADRFAVPAPRDVIRHVITAVDDWPEHADAAGVGTDQVDRIAADHRRFRPDQD